MPQIRTLTKEILDNLTPQEVLHILQNGNNRFINNLRAHHDLLEQVNETKDWQHPFAIILSCMDSRTSAELIFDQGLGDIFSVRVAGNILNADVLGSLEFACAIIGVKLIVVLGHTGCGAIKGVLQQAQLDPALNNLNQLLDKLHPVLRKTERMNCKLQLEDRINAIAATNVRLVRQQITQSSIVLRQYITQAQVGLVSGMYNVETGRVDFYDDEFSMFDVK